MKRLPFFVLLCALGSGSLNAQWAQTSLGDAQYGYNLFSDASGVWAATLNGVYQTDDSGNPWFSRGLSGRLVFDVIKSGQFMLAATEGTGPNVYRTSDNGANWLPASGLSDQSVRAFASNSSYVFACTWSGGIFRSSDNGANWQSLGLANQAFRSMYAVGEIVFAGGFSIYFSTDNGTSWTGRQLPYPAGDTRCFAHHNGKLYAGDVGLYMSEDLGLTWTLRYGVKFDQSGTATDSKIFYDLASYNQALVASMGPGGLCISQDGDTNWVDWNEGVQADWSYAALAIRSPYIWSLRGFFGNAFRRDLTDIVTGIEISANHVPTEYSLSQNYPNPFNPTTIIGYSVSGASSQGSGNSDVKLAVYDELGREVAVLVDEAKAPGTYEVAFNARNMASGVYLYRLQAGSFVQSRKLLLLR